MQLVRISLLDSVGTLEPTISQQVLLTRPQFFVRAVERTYGCCWCWQSAREIQKANQPLRNKISRWNSQITENRLLASYCLRDLLQHRAVLPPSLPPTSGWIVRMLSSAREKPRRHWEDPLLLHVVSMLAVENRARENSLCCNDSVLHFFRELNVEQMTRASAQRQQRQQQ